MLWVVLLCESCFLSQQGGPCLCFLLSSHLYQVEVRILEHLNAIDLCLEGGYCLAISDPEQVATVHIIIGTGVTIS